jgi:beta-mannosidase
MRRLFVFAWSLALMLLVPRVAAAPVPAVPLSISLNSGWEVRLASNDAVAAAHPQATRWLPAAVPGAVQTDLMAAGLLADPWAGDNEGAAQWVGLSDWQYRTEFTADAALLTRSHIDLVFEGLDTLAMVRINGVQVLAADNMFRRWRVPAKALLRPGRNLVEVAFSSPIRALQPQVLAMKHPLPGSYDSRFGDEPAGRQTANYVRKANYQYGWDWAPRLVTIGIWRPVRLEAYDGVRLDDFHVAQIHLDDEAAVLAADVDIWSDRTRTLDVNVSITAPDGVKQSLQQRVTLFAGMNPVVIPARVAKPKRWWPVGYGAPDRYVVKARIARDGIELGAAQHAIGLRTTELRRDKDPWGRAMTLVINGVPIFVKGANLVPSDSFPSRVPKDRTDTLLQSAVDAHMNMLRVWGGGYYPDDALYDTADRLGLMLWQEFMFGGALPPNDFHFRENTRAEATQQVRRLRDHASVVIWCGNNEVQASWEKWADRQAFKATLTPAESEDIDTGMLRLFDQVLRSAVALNAPGTPYVAGSPSTDYDGPADQMTDGDVHFWDVWVSKPLEDYLTTTPRFMSEFGIQSMPSLRSLKEFVAPATLASAPVELKNGYDSGRGNARLLSYVRAQYGEPASFADYVYLSQLVQAEGMEMAVTHLRSSRPQSMGAMYWTLNDAWPGQINAYWAGPAWGSIDFFGRWKATHYHARRFNAPVAIGAQRIGGVTSVTLISDRMKAFEARWRLRVLDRDGALISERGGAAAAAALAATPLAHLTDAQLLGGADPARSLAVAEVMEGAETLSRSFVYFVRAQDFALIDPRLTTTLSYGPRGSILLTVSSTTLARGVWVDFGDLDVALSDNSFDLAPGETRTLTATSRSTLAELQGSLKVRSLFGATVKPTH